MKLAHFNPLEFLNDAPPSLLATLSASLSDSLTLERCENINLAKTSLEARMKNLVLYEGDCDDDNGLEKEKRREMWIFGRNLVFPKIKKLNEPAAKCSNNPTFRQKCTLKHILDFEMHILPVSAWGKSDFLQKCF